MQKKVTFKNSKGQRLVGALHIPKGSPRSLGEAGQGPFPTVIVCHGFKSSHNNRLIKSISQNLEKKGFVTLRFSLSGHKPSGGNYKNVLVSQFIKDIERAIKFLLKVPQVNKNRIGMAGHSMGAFTSLLCANKLNQYIRSVVSISSLYNPAVVIKSYQRDKKIEEIGRDYWVISGFKVTNKHFHDRLYLKGKYLISEIHCPSLIIHGNQDKRVNVKEAYKNFNLLNEPKELKIIKGADHNFTNQKYRQQVVKLTTNWFKKYLAFKESKVINVFLEHNGKLLILKRSQKVGTHRGRWCAVGGYLEEGKSMVQQAREEVREELGITYKKLSDYKIGKPFKFSEKSIDRIWFVHPILFKLKTQPKIKLDWENTDYKWVRPEEVLKYKTIPMMEKDLKAFDLVKKASDFRRSRVVDVVLQHKDKILILKRSQHVIHYKHHWSGVGGHLEKGETILQTTQREVAEELNISKSQKLFKLGKSFTQYYKDIKATWTTYPVLLKFNKKPRIRLNKENSQYKWIKPKEMKKYKLVPMQLETLKRLGLINK